MQIPPVILAIETSLGPCSAALWREGAVAAQAHEPEAGRQSRLLVPFIESVLAEAKLDYAGLTAIACTVGPGGFTGIRTGLATARAIALAADKPLIGLTTLETIAFAEHHTGDVLAVIDAYRGQYYIQRFRSSDAMTAQSEPLLVDAALLGALSHGAKTVQTLPHAVDVAALAARKWEAGERDFPTLPLYIREPDAKLPANNGLDAMPSVY